MYPTLEEEENALGITTHADLLQVHKGWLSSPVLADSFPFISRTRKSWVFFTNWINSGSFWTMISGCQSVPFRSLSHSSLCKWRSVCPFPQEKEKIRKTRNWVVLLNIPIVFYTTMPFATVKHSLLPILCFFRSLRSQWTMNPPEKVWQRILHACCTVFACNIAYGVGGILQANSDLEEVIRRHPYLSKLVEKGM